MFLGEVVSEYVLAAHGAVVCFHLAESRHSEDGKRIAAGVNAALLEAFVLTPPPTKPTQIH